MVQPASIIVKTTQPKRFGKGLGIGSFVWKHKLIFVTLFFFIPTISLIVSQTVNDRNILVPIIAVGTALLNADQLIYQDVNTLKEDPNSLLLLKEEEIDEEAGFFNRTWKKIKFFFNRTILLWKILANIWFLFINWRIYTWVWSLSDRSRVGRNYVMGLITLVIVMIFTNLILLVIDISAGEDEVDFTRDETYGKAVDVFLKIIPFRGLVSLVIFIPEFLKLLAKISPFSPKEVLEGVINNTNVSA